ncbi:hypothetical protein NIES2107_60070 [Nostoc carneum NIES-2107]|nr:hypothetical protein NIES2107_60070 [Nostoc carneum NIES-2107]
MQVSDIIASLALIVAGASFWFQQKSDRKQLMVSNFLEYTKRYQEIIVHFPKEVVDENFNLSSFSENEQEEILRYMWMYFDLCYEEYSLYKLGYIDLDLWSIWESGIKSSFSRSAFQQSWHLIRGNTNYKSDLGFAKFIESILQSRLRRN